jgi:hypothetical protein
VLLGVNMQTSFMHPPFGFALFYLRSVAPAHPYVDKVTGRATAPVTTGQIYWGAIPFVLIQLVMVALLIAFPQMSLVYKSGEPVIDMDKVKIEIPQDEPADSRDDVMKQLQQGAPPGSAGAAPASPPVPTDATAAKPGSSGDAATDELLKQLGGK